jgi:hypothetical protein
MAIHDCLRQTALVASDPWNRRLAKLLWWQAILGIVVWPYYLGLMAR